jgi:hypothetical protein
MRRRQHSPVGQFALQAHVVLFLSTLCVVLHLCQAASVSGDCNVFGTKWVHPAEKRAGGSDVNELIKVPSNCLFPVLDLHTFS